MFVKLKKVLSKYLTYSRWWFNPCEFSNEAAKERSGRSAGINIKEINPFGFGESMRVWKEKKVYFKILE